MNVDKMSIIIIGIQWIFQLIMWTTFLYYFVISIFGWIKRKEVPASYFPRRHKFAIVISAHDEEAVIGGAIKSLKDLNYPKDMYDIYVIADNCKDKTAAVARKKGAKVHERFDDVYKGKGYALEWMFKRLLCMEAQYDAICIFDADNLVSKNFLLEMNKQLCLGHNVIQGYLDSKNPSDSWISGNYSISYWASNRLFQLPRYYLGLSCALGGTGFVMRTEVLKEIGWGATCLTEDLEFSIKLVAKGMRVSWAHKAIVYDEKPLRLSQSWKQRRRWMQGHSKCATKYFTELMTKAIKNKSFICFDMALYLVQPFMVAFSGIGLLMSISKLINFIKSDNLITAGHIIFGLLFFAMLYFNVIFLFAEGKLSKKIMAYLFIFPIYGLTWIPIVIQGFFNRNKTEWVHTLHTRDIDINDIEALEKVG